RICGLPGQAGLGRYLGIGGLAGGATGAVGRHIEIVVVHAQTAEQAQGVRQVPGGFAVHTDRAFFDLVVADVFDEASGLVMIEPDTAGIVVTALATDHHLPGAVVDQRTAGLATDDPALVELIDLVVVGRVGLHVPVVVLGVERGVPVVTVQGTGEDHALRLAVGRGVQRAEGIGAGHSAD